MGLSEAHQVLTLNNLRDRVMLRTDGGITHRAGHGDRRDAGGARSSASARGADRHGLHHGAAVPANTCPVGVCTQDRALRAKFTGTAEKVVNLFSFIAEEVREILASARGCGRSTR